MAHKKAVAKSLFDRAKLRGARNCQNLPKEQWIPEIIYRKYKLQFQSISKQVI